ncbi:hypothetical protein WKV44_02405 [Spirochaetia bacterium 38H-sp]|uniref:Uncharacterized protein n=1 Tax=Rarispira pelagica TaxID=3141764 RepID=A0ABU9UA97_9SPIR
MGRRDRESWEERKKRREERAEEEIITGGAMMLVFGFMMISLTGWLIFPFVFAGLIPFTHGIRRLIQRNLRNRLDSKPKKPASIEKQILMSAKEHNGVVTPTIIALETDLNLKESEKELQKLAEEGHASMEITRNGTIEYHFPEFKKELPPQ